MISNEDFVTAWMAAKVKADVYKLLPQMSPSAIEARAAFLRRRGVKLKKFGRSGRPKIDVSALNRLIKML